MPFSDYWNMAKDVVLDANDKFCAKMDGALADHWGEKLDYACDLAISCYNGGLHDFAQQYYHMILEIACQSEGAHDAHVDRIHRLLSHIEGQTLEEDRAEISRDRIVTILALKKPSSRRQALEIYIGQTFPHIVNPVNEPQPEPV